MGTVGDKHSLNVTVTLSLQDVSLYGPEPGASEESLASREAEPVSLGPARAEEVGGSHQSPWQERWTGGWGTTSVVTGQSRG